ncbi:hypothetical protein BD413DRAFT_114161 [Trametes elegans]|nr:hypothetical protein BD413DRAFT_114161 [Trametes elegans]
MYKSGISSLRAASVSPGMDRLRLAALYPGTTCALAEDVHDASRSRHLERDSPSGWDASREDSYRDPGLGLRETTRKLTTSSNVQADSFAEMSLPRRLGYFPASCATAQGERHNSASQYGRRIACSPLETELHIVIQLTWHVLPAALLEPEHRGCSRVVPPYPVTKSRLPLPSSSTQDPWSGTPPPVISLFLLCCNVNDRAACDAQGIQYSI